MMNFAKIYIYFFCKFLYKYFVFYILTNITNILNSILVWRPIRRMCVKKIGSNCLFNEKRCMQMQYGSKSKKIQNTKYGKFRHKQYIHSSLNKYPFHENEPGRQVSRPVFNSHHIIEISTLRRILEEILKKISL